MRLLRRVATGLSLVAVAAAATVWLLWIPSPREPGYVFVTAWGGQGRDPGRFDEPTGVALADGRVFVSDARNRRIQVFDRDGRFLREIGRGVLGRPMNLDIRGERLYVADYWEDRITVFTLDGRLLGTVGGSGPAPGRFDSPGGVAAGPDGDLYIADFYGQRVQRLRPDGAFVRQWGVTGKVGIRAGLFNYPTDVAVAPDGTLYVADGYNDRVQVFGPDGRFLRKWGGPLGMNVFGPFNGWFATVTAIALGPDGSVFVADFYNDRIQKFAPDGTFLTAFGETGAGPGQFRGAIAVAVAADGTVFAVDFRNHRVQMWRPAARSGSEGEPAPE